MTHSYLPTIKNAPPPSPPPHSDPGTSPISYIPYALPHDTLETIDPPVAECFHFCSIRWVVAAVCRSPRYSQLCPLAEEVSRTCGGYAGKARPTGGPCMRRGTLGSVSRGITRGRLQVRRSKDGNDGDGRRNA